MRFTWTGSLAVVALVAAVVGAACGKKDAVKPDVPAVAVADGKPSIACDQAEYDFGTVQQGDEARHVFKMKNVGNALLKIDSARGG